ncbi:MAG: helix-hairpin-helix domain-containing protein, partial [Bacteroidota bacterium]|nr:helix-hairpin-helix domain-containing protein [Bacteroidota bacterium]
LVHREEFGELISIFELQSVEGFDLEIIEKLRPFIFVGKEVGHSTYTFRDLFSDGKHEIATRYSRTVENQHGYIDTSEKGFLGSGYQLMNRYNYRFGTRLSIGMTTEKDAGEELFKGSQPLGFDFYSAHLYYTGDRRLKTFAIGDYNLQIGQGLTFWSSFGFGKTADVMNIARQGRGILPFRSANESGYLRGSAFTYQSGHFTLTCFGSTKMLDANFNVDTLSPEDAHISALLLSGYHRNEAELSDKHTVRESLGGAEVKYSAGRLRLGFSTVYGGYSKPLADPQRLYDKFGLAGSSFLNAGVHYSWLYENAYFFGESAVSGNKGLATINGMLISLHKLLDAAIVYRNYSKYYQAPYGRAFGESTANSNEKGVYFALSYAFAPHWKLGAYVDIFSFPWLRYRVDAPSQGYEYLADIQYDQSKKFSLVLRYRFQSKPLNLNEGQPLHAQHHAARQSARVHLQYKVNASVRLRTRIELSDYVHNTVNEKGFLGYQDIAYNPLGKPYDFTFRYTLFDVDSYNARIYAFENDMPYTFSIPFFNDEGARWYVLAQYRFSRGLSAWVRISRTSLWQSKTIGSGLSLINAPHRTDVKVMLRYNFRK